MAPTELNDRTNQNSHPAPGNADSGGMIGPYSYGGLPYVMTAGGRIVSLSQPPGDVLPADQGLLDPAMLIAERYLQVEDPLAVALEAEVPGLDHAGVHGAYGDLVHAVAFHL